MSEHERIALVDTLIEFAKSGSYRKQFVTSLCNYYFSANDLLLLLNALVENPLNVGIVQSSNIWSTLTQFLTSGTEMEKDSVVEILWRLCHNHNVRSHIISTVPQIQKRLPVEVFGNKKPLLFSSYPFSESSDKIQELQIGINA